MKKNTILCSIFVRFHFYCHYCHKPSFRDGHLSTDIYEIDLNVHHLDPTHNAFVRWLLIITDTDPNLPK